MATVNRYSTLSDIKVESCVKVAKFLVDRYADHMQKCNNPLVPHNVICKMNGTLKCKLFRHTICVAL